MKKYKHWLKIDGCCFDTEKQYKEIENCLKKYPESKITIYQNNNSLFDWVVLLECSQNYNDLDMIVNSGSNRLRRLLRKPRDIKERNDLKISNGDITAIKM